MSNYKNIYNNIKGNEVIKSYLSNINNQPFLIGRSGIVEMRSCFSYYRYGQLSDILKFLLKNNAGVYNTDVQHFAKIYTNAISSSDLNVWWSQDDLLEEQTLIYDLFTNNSTIFYHNRSVESYYFDKPWSQLLKDKRILIIHPFVDSIQYQYTNKRLLWNNKNILPDFELITYKSIQSIGNTGPHLSWLESLEKMQEDITNINFDIALIGCGAYGLPLGAFIKNYLLKSAIHMGGALQILFGIKGTRWDHHDEISKFYNDYWIRPQENEKPKSYKTVEEGCYW